ncbi:sensor histidine kinase [Haematomicrobium sanguinis]|uniref:sensor histidine kinase n=1 Tax=Haematomicrobium sanguinis TaxID=479106 RepID=UPI00047AC803|nr:ATP-binding protein [Haematomicrobium sanguinis]
MTNTGTGTAKRGELKVYLGFAPGVGKTYAMLQEARDLAAHGVDVVVGHVEAHGRAKTESLAEGLPTIAPMELVYRGAAHKEMNLEALLARAPEVAIVDELAHTNIPGSPHEKRWQDVHSLLEAGINVISTVNIQHLASLVDVVRAITGVTQRETIPDRVLRASDQIELVDLSADALRIRLSKGEIYRPDRVDAALSQYFRVGNLNSLRELALLWLADQVDEAIAAYRGEKNISATWPARERIVVAVTGGRESETLVRRGIRIVGRIAGRQLLGVHVRHDDGLVASQPGSLHAARELVESAGGTFHVVTGDDVASALVEFARSVNASQLVIGVSRARWYHRLFGPGVGTRVIQGSGEMDVHMVTHQEAGSGGRGAVRDRGARLSLVRRVLGWVAAVVGPLGLTGLFMVLGGAETSLTVNFLVHFSWVVLVALIGGWWPSMVSALLSTALLNWFFTLPLGTFTISQPENIVALALFVAVAAGVARVVDLAARRLAVATRAQYQASLLSDLASGVISEGNNVQGLLEKIRETLGQRSVTLRGRGAGEAVVSGGVENRGAAGVPPEFSGVPSRKVLALDDDYELVAEGPPISAADQKILAAFGGRIVAVLHQEELAAERVRSEELAAANAARTALLAAVSHDLRTPLAGIKASVSSLRTPGLDLDPVDREELMFGVERSTDQLSALVANLLDMSRIHAGALVSMREDVDVAHLIRRVLSSVPAHGPQAPREVAGAHPDAQSSPPIDLAVGPGCAVVRTDAGLLERIVANIVENAAKHAPGAPLVISVSRTASMMQIRFADHGAGVSPAQRAHMFQPFQRFDDTSADGIGLGLAVARGLAEAIGGTLSAEDTPGGGLTLVLTLPMDNESSQEDT